MVTAEVNCVSAQQQPRRREGARHGVRLGSDDSGRTPVVLKMTLWIKKKKNVCIYFL